MFLNKSLLTLASIAIVVAAFGLATVEAAKPGKGKRGQVTPEQALGRFDRDGDGTLSPQEAQRAKSFYAALKQLDKDNDGTLSDSELNAVKPAARPAGKAGGKKKTQ